jgi:hypothetical protein
MRGRGGRGREWGEEERGDEFENPRQILSNDYS